MSWPVRSVVVLDGGGEGRDVLRDADGRPSGGVPAVAFEVELACEGVAGGLDDLPQRREELLVSTVAAR